MKDEPTIRAVQTQALLQAIRGLPEFEQSAIRAAVDPAAFVEVERSLPVAWMPMSIHMALSDAVRDVVGPERNVALWIETMTAVWSRPLLRGFVDAMTKVLGVGPAGLLKQSPRVYGHLTRDLGTLSTELEGGGRSANVILDGFPAKKYRFICYVEGMHGCIESTLPLARHEGTVRVAEVVEARGRVVYRVEWE